jgi:hypothetical protein
MMWLKSWSCARAAIGTPQNTSNIAAHAAHNERSSCVGIWPIRLAAVRRFFPLSIPRCAFFVRFQS